MPHTSRDVPLSRLLWMPFFLPLAVGQAAHGRPPPGEAVKSACPGSIQRPGVYGAWESGTGMSSRNFISLDTINRGTRIVASMTSFSPYPQALCTGTLTHEQSYRATFLCGHCRRRYVWTTEAIRQLLFFLSSRQGRRYVAQRSRV